MGIEIERKFLVNSDQWRRDVCQQTVYKQGYLASHEHLSVRVRITSNAAKLAIKSGTRGIRRLEYEYDIPLQEGEEMLAQLCADHVVEKTRYDVPYEGFVWEVDVFAQANQGLVVAEVELATEDQVVPLPTWVGQEVSTEQRYFNACLSTYPYQQWTAAEKNPAALRCEL